MKSPAKLVAMPGKIKRTSRVKTVVQIRKHDSTALGTEPIEKGGSKAVNRFCSAVVKALLLQAAIAIVAALVGWGNAVGVDIFGMVLILASAVAFR